jgi:phosphatidate cytidylyltransferase
MFRVRAATALVCVPLMLVVVSWGAEVLWGVIFLACVAASTVLGMRELYSSLSRMQIRPVVEVGYVAGVGLLIVVWWAPRELQGHAISVILAITIAASLIAHFGTQRETSPVKNVGGTLLGVIWIGLLFTYFLRLRQIDLGYTYPWLSGDDWWSFFRRNCGALVVTFSAVWLSDTAAFIVGKTLGRRKLCPYLSPHKTVEGAIGAFFGAALFGLLAAWIMGIPVVHGAVLGAIIGVVGQLGDLSQSALKRDIQIKDFGDILPGHGGIMDRFDSALFAMPVAFLYFKLFTTI